MLNPDPTHPAAGPAGAPTPGERAPLTDDDLRQLGRDLAEFTDLWSARMRAAARELLARRATERTQSGGAAGRVAGVLSLIAAARAEVSALCKGRRRGGRDWTMCIPVRDDDSDMVIGNALDAARLALTGAQPPAPSPAVAALLREFEGWVRDQVLIGPRCTDDYRRFLNERVDAARAALDRALAEREDALTDARCALDLAEKQREREVESLRARLAAAEASERELRDVVIPRLEERHAYEIGHRDALIKSAEAARDTARRYYERAWLELAATREALGLEPGQNMMERSRVLARDARADALGGALAAEVTRLLDGMEVAWGVIANVSLGDWDMQKPEWQAAAKRWRDEYWHAALKRRSTLAGAAGGASTPEHTP